jgi:hypothetical protein
MEDGHSYSYTRQEPISLQTKMEAETLFLTHISGVYGAQSGHSILRPTPTSTSTSMDSSFSYELPMEWRASQSFEYQPYPSPYPSPAPSFVSRPPHHSHSSSVSNGPPTASPTLSSTTSSPHVTNHAHSHSHNAPIDPSLQEPYVHSWSHQPQGPQSPIIGAQTQSPVTVANPYGTPPPSAKPASAMSRQELEQELARLKTRVNELEVIHHWLELKGMRLETDVPHHSRMPQPLSSQGHGHAHHHHHHSQQQHSSNAHHITSAPTITPAPSSINDQPITGGVAPTEEFAATWRARTDARIKRFCALNRAGNALCAWHDSRRERRAYPPRQAPPGYLNCGCTNEEGKSTFLFPYFSFPASPLAPLCNWFILTFLLCIPRPSPWTLGRNTSSPVRRVPREARRRVLSPR